MTDIPKVIDQLHAISIATENISVVLILGFTAICMCIWFKK